jgi:hemoglobin/transferrin/lactoferrin receptor protein
MAPCRNLAVILAFSTVLSSAAFAQTSTATDETTEGYYTLREIIVRGGQDPAATPGAVADTLLASTATREVLAERQITSIEDLGRSLEPGVNFNRTNGAVNIRGLEGPRVLTTVDGIPVPYLNDTTRGSSGGVDLFEFSSLAGVDIVRGTDSSRAGSGALGGVLGLRTLEPGDLIREGRNWGGIAGLTYDGSDNSFRPSLAVAGRSGNTSVLLQGSYKRGNETENAGTLDSYGPSRTLPNPVDYDQYNLLFKLRHELEGGHTVGLTAETFRRDREIDDRRQQGSTPGSQYRPGDYTSFESGGRDRISLDYRYDGGGFVDFAAASLYWLDQQRGSGYEGIRSASVQGPIWRDNTYDETTIGFIGSAEKTFTTGDFSHRLMAGLDVSGSSSSQYTAGGDNCSVVYVPTCANLHTNQADEPEVDNRKFGFFIDNEIGIGQTGFFITPGARFDWVDRDPRMTPEFARNPTRPDLPDAFNDSAISPKIRLAYRPSDTIELYSQWAMGFRAPTSGELYSTFGGPGTYLRRGNDQLQSETSQGIEIGVRYGDENFGVRASLFHNRYRNFIEAVTVPGFDPTYPFGITEFQNLNRVRISGVEAAMHKRFANGFHLAGSLAFARGENLDTGTYLGSVAPLKGVATLGYATQTWGADVTLIGVSGVSDNSDATFKAPGYGIVDVTAWWKPEQLNGFTIRGGVYNLFDKEYYDAINVRSVAVTGASGFTPANQAYLSEPGRFFKVSLAKEF